MEKFNSYQFIFGDPRELCEVCEDAEATREARFHELRLCDGCYETEPVPEQ